MKFGIYGSAKSKTDFAHLLKEKGKEISALYCEDFQSCVEAAVRLGCTACYSAGELADECDVIIISLPDDEVRRAVLRLLKEDLSGKIVCAESASAVSGVLGDIAARAHISLHVPDGKNVYIEGKGEGYREFYEYLLSIGINANEITSADKARYDLAMFFCQSGISTLVGMARELMDGIGAINNFDDLIYANVERSLETSEITGAVPEYDIAAIRRHTDMATGNNAAVYKTLVLKAAEMSKLSNDEKARIKNIIIGR